ncbi:TetR/AcrR family transcriptional regulator [Nocardia alni]|uniref:TetR/AcrR family transcriptional regulator n=1 Tax=Nocardia alni TaxID=2815723 RepID=UPI001C24046F|nr:TetR/AcrR family transcriptional regulator [Nocardia alni]
MTTEATARAGTPAGIPVVDDSLVQAALRAAAELGKDVADVPVAAIAARAGISRSTLLRRLGGSRAALDEAVRARGVDTGGAAPVRTRALDAAAVLIAENGLGAATLDAIAARADCSVPSLYTAFGSRDGLLRAVYDRHSPLLDIEEFLAETRGDLAVTVHGLYTLMAESFSRHPRVAPAMFADSLARPNSVAAQPLLSYTAPRVLTVVGDWLTGQIQAGRIRDIPVPLLIQQLLAPIGFHMLMRGSVTEAAAADQPDVGTVCDVYTDTFLRAVATTPPVT